jgi:hypothetical protein
MATKKITEQTAGKVELYDRLIATVPGVERKGKTLPYTSIKGHMFSFLDKNGTLGLRLPEAERDAFLKKYKTTLCLQYGAVMKEYVTVPEKLLGDTKTLKKYMMISHAYVAAMKPKPTKKSKRG